MNQKKIVLAIGGSSGSIYAKLLMDKLSLIKDITVGVCMSKNALINWEIEIGPFNKESYPFDFYDSTDFNAPFASGSAQYNYMVVCPCSMGLLARMAQGISNDLSTRAADVILKEKRKLIVVAREMPYSTIHLNNMALLDKAGALIMPASPSFYSKPNNVEELCMTVVDRVMDHLDIEQSTYRWGE